MADDTTGTTTSTDDTNTDDDGDLGDLGDAGKRALQAERARASEAEKASKNSQRALKALQDELTAIKAAGLSEQEQVIAKAKAEARAEVEKELLGKANTRLVRAEVRAVAAGKLDVDLAERLVDIDGIEVSDDGIVDRKAISRAIKSLLDEHPNLADGATSTRGSADGGARGTALSGSDMNQQLRRATGRA